MLKDILPSFSHPTHLHQSRMLQTAATAWQHFEDGEIAGFLKIEGRRAARVACWPVAPPAPHLKGRCGAISERQALFVWRCYARSRQRCSHRGALQAPQTCTGFARPSRITALEEGRCPQKIFRDGHKNWRLYTRSRAWSMDAPDVLSTQAENLAILDKPIWRAQWFGGAWDAKIIALGADVLVQRKILCIY